MNIVRNAILLETKCNIRKQDMSLWTILLIFLCSIKLSDLNKSQHRNSILNNDITRFKFKHSVYNVTIPENSVGKTYAVPNPHEDTMGISIYASYEVKYRIMEGDPDKLFKADERIVGDIAFLVIRTRTSNIILNREKNDDYTLRIKAFINSVNADNVRSDETLVHIKVLDRNDLSPLFYPIEYSQTILEDMQIHTRILKVEAEDADLGINGEIYYSFMNDNEYFAIHPTSGVITLTKQLKHTEHSQFELTVLASDRGSILNRNSHQASKAKVSIIVEQVNLHSPEIHIKTVPGIIANFSSLVSGIVNVIDKDKGRHGEIKKVDVVDGDPDGNFIIVPTADKGEYNIEIRKFSKLDESFVHNLTLRAEDNGIPPRSSYKIVPVHIMKSKIHSPVFTKHIYEVSIPETSPPNTPVIRLKVIDPDLGKNALVYLQIVGGNEGGEFKINPDSGMLYTQKSLDADSKSFYSLTVSAIDQANVGVRKQSSAKVKINIQDMNDNDPIFEPMNTTLMLNENDLAGAFVTKLTAKDKDTGENSYISYSIANLNEVPFEIDHFSGVIRTTTLIDYETMRREYILRIRASDWGLPYRRQTELELLIKIKDINDNRPQFERVNCFGKLLRSTPVGTEIFTLSAIDFDSGDYITYRVLMGNEDGCFNLDPTTGILSVGCDLSDVGIANRTINVSATDGTHFSDEMHMNIKLTSDLSNKIKHSEFSHAFGTFECRETGVARRLAENMAASEKNNADTLDKMSLNGLGLIPSRYGENVHNPEFVDFPQELQLNESIDLGETVVWIKARDRDLGYNGKLVYAISDGDSDSVFRIDPENGELQIIGYLDRERQDEYILNITVFDLGQPQKSQSKIIPVIVLDNNDNPPIFQKSLATIRIPENAFNGTLIYCLNASDADSGKNGKITYIIKTSTEVFSVNRTTGCIYLKGRLDREKQEMYELHVKAKDNGAPFLTAEAVINVFVEDINDNAPVFGVQEFIFKVREDIPRGTVLACIEATDADIGQNSEIYFTLKEDIVDKGLFKIDKSTGVIKTQGFLDYETRQVHNLIVSAIDRGTPSMTANMGVVIEVIDVNENWYPPEFEDFVFIGKIKENQRKGSFVMNITATDLDITGPDSKISYSIRGGDGIGFFTVNDQGLIRTLTHLDAETKSNFWLTLCAQDHGIVPLSNCVQVYIEIEDENDNVPMTDKPVYYKHVIEGSPPNTKIMQLEAEDNDIYQSSDITYKIISGNPEGFFSINNITGEVTTTERKLDRENQSEHILEISMCDNGIPPLTSTTRVVVTVDDINDNTPEFDQRFYKIQVPSTVAINETIFQVQAFDNDIGENGRVSYFVKSGKGKNRFRMDPNTGFIYLSKALEIDTEYELKIQAEDNGIPKRFQTARLSVMMIDIISSSQNSPKVNKIDNVVDVTESDRPGFLVALISVTDEDSDYLWYYISDGDPRNEFYIGRDNGNILLSKSLDWETQQMYNLTISVTDGSNIVNTYLSVQVIDTNDNRPIFTKEVYYVNILENIEEESVIMQLHATDVDEDNKIFYNLHAAQDPISLSLFRIDSITGSIIVTQRLDYEKNKHHVLIAIARDQGTPAKRDYAKIIITIHDHNDHYPEFTSKIIQSKVPESTTIGSRIAQVVALDQDCGKNAEIKYSIITGNVGNTFEVDESSGMVTLSKSLNINRMQEYMLQIKASDCGEPALSSQIPLHIIVVMSENDPPVFLSPSKIIEIFENLSIGTFVTLVEARSSSSVFYDIATGNHGSVFNINPSTGVITINNNIDYENNKFFNLTISATNLASASSVHHVTFHILDTNDNLPFFIQFEYWGQINEDSDIGSFVNENNTTQNRPLRLQASDYDSGTNGMIEYNILDNIAKMFFKIEPLTGAIKLLRKLDFEVKSEFNFEVMANDMGTPRLFSKKTALVHIIIKNINDCPPVFKQKEINVTLYLPSYNNIIVAEVNASDADNDDNTIRYDIVDGNVNDCFEINRNTGVITTRNVEHIKATYTLHIRASDGMYSAIAQVNINTESITDAEFMFQKSKYKFSAVENSTKIVVIGLVNVIGNYLHENVEYHILNPTTMFQIGRTSGALKTTGIVFDREMVDKYTLVVEAISFIFLKKHKQIRRASVLVEISILDVNDNCPIFVNLPYYATVSIDDPKGTVITKVKAVDLDSFENGEVRYEMKKGNGELFKIDRKSGELILKQSIEGHSRNYELTVAAYDGAISPCSTDVSVNIKIIDKSMPFFNKQFYSTSVKEDVEIYSTIPLTIHAESPMGRNLIYTISSGNDDEFFEIDFRTGIIAVVNELDYESRHSHELQVRAIDSVSGIFAEVTASINIEDTNDCYPEIEKDVYNITLLENVQLGSLILKINASDADTKANGELSYSIESINGNSNLDMFYIDFTDGSLFLKNILDYEVSNFYHLIISVKDHGTPSLISRTNVWITVMDLNDNFPQFIEPSFSCKLSINATRGQFVTIAKGYDPDISDNDNLKYKIVDGNELQTYSINERTGIITLQNMNNFTRNHQTSLNVSLTDGVHTSYSRVKIVFTHENLHSPKFLKSVYELNIKENETPGQHLITVQATDPDFGKFSTLAYSIVTEEMKKYFRIDELNGTIESRISFDREKCSFYEVYIKVSDRGGKFDYTVLKVNIIDVNDNPPIFKLKKYKTMAKTNIALNATVLKIKAEDADEKENCQIKYIIDYRNLDVAFKEYLVIDEKTGSINIRKSASNLTNSIIEFFVRAEDNGIPKLHNEVAVLIQFIDASVDIPEFEKRFIELHYLESLPPGSMLTKLRVLGNFSMKFSILTDSPKFSVSEDGDVILMQTLDREEKDTHFVVVMGETSTVPTFFSYCELNIYVLDENDNSPKFDSSIYIAEVIENIDKVTSIIKVTATDEDDGSNSDIRYYLENDGSVKSNIFDIDIYSGWITLLSTVDRESQSEYYFHVLAADKGQPQHVSKVPVVIKLIDHNDNPPLFKKQRYELSVKENALPGTVLFDFVTTDLDSEKGDIDYYIVAGDKYAQFQISSSGELFISKLLDREMIAAYNLSLLATDGKLFSKAEALINVKDVNDNIPVCITSRYKLTINESTPIGTSLLQVTATDFDEGKNKELRFYLTGNNSDDFNIEKETGILKVAKPIDREIYSKYMLVAHAQDSQELSQECNSEIFISVNDFNDNKPEFSMQQYMVSINEDAPINTVVTKVHATDKDFGLNRKVQYSFVEEIHNFQICPLSGIIRLLNSLDRESVSMFNISIQAEDSGEPKQFARVNLIINVLDVNDNPPEFLEKNYFANVYENSTLNTELITIHAVSKDIGINAEIAYFIIGGNEQNKFRINSKSGIIFVNGDLDYEKAQSYFLTVQAIDGGTPPLSNVASVNISIFDVNDNQPKFLQNTYHGTIKEDSPPGAKILQVMANDEDSGMNGIIKYNIERGDRLNQFEIEESSGFVLLLKNLDREIVSHYLLELRACDCGVPELCSYVQISIDVLDANDNPPLFEHQNYSVYLQENKNIGHVLLTFNVTDGDEYPNAAPYTFDFRSGNEGGIFRIEQDGTLRTAARFSHNIRDLYILQIRVFDNGTPPLYSDTWIYIQIVEESQYPPVVMPLEITVESFEDDFSGGFLGCVYASDHDKYDTLNFDLSPTKGELFITKELFNISRYNGSLYAVTNLDIGIYNINVTVSDGKYTTNTIIRVNVELVTSEMTSNAVIVKFNNVSPEEFILSNRKGFIRAIRLVMRCRQKDITVITIQKSQVRNVFGNSSNSRSINELHRRRRSFENNLDVVFAVRKQQITPNSEGYFSSEEIYATIITHVEEIEDNTNLIVEEIVTPACSEYLCFQGDCINRVILNKNNISTFYTDVTSFASPSYSYVHECKCKQGFDGKNCNEIVNSCSSDPCPLQKQCVPADNINGYQCICPRGFSGQYCDSRVLKCQNATCNDKFTSVSFSGKSYAHYKINKFVVKNILENQFTCSLMIRTVQQTGTLLYASGKIDFHILEVYNGIVQYRFELGSGEATIGVSSIYVSDGEWHTIALERVFNSAKLSVDGKHISQGSAPGVNGVLNIQSNDIFVGAEVRPHPSIIGFEDIQRGFIGCMDDIRVANELLPLYVSGGSSIAALKRFTNVEFPCNSGSVLIDLGICGNQPCENGGTCNNLGQGKFKCLCHARFTGQKCEIDLDSCASSPCLYGGQCKNYGLGNYTCACPLHLSGKRCEYGKFCTPNPCKNGGVCEEGDSIAHCMCRGYTGLTCEVDVNECDKHPCGNGATCINEAGSFRCICPSYLTGASCGDPLYSNSISTKLRNLSIEHITGIIAGIIIVCILIVIFFCCIIIRKRNRNNESQSFNANSSYKGVNLNSLTDKERYVKHNANTKLSNLDINHRTISYASSTNENVFPSNATFVNNLDILRSYGSAGDELENIPFEYQKISRTNEQVNINACHQNDTETTHRPDWCDQLHLKTFSENKLNNEKKIEYGLPLNDIKSNNAKMIQVAMPNLCCSANAEYSSLNHGQYHWDCSDWAEKGHNPLPDITEVPVAEIVDSSSFHSNDSNESKPMRSYMVQGVINSSRDIATLNEDLTSECIDSELEKCINSFQLPLLSSKYPSRLSPFNDNENEDFITNTGRTYVRHPNTYLPPLNDPNETEGLSSGAEQFSGLNGTNRMSRRESENSESVYLFGQTSCRQKSNSNVSVHLCEIEDSESEEFLPK